MKALILIASFLFYAELTYAGGLTPSVGVEQTGVLPKGVRNPRIRHYNIQLGDNFNNARVSQPIASALNQKVSWNQMINAQEGVQKTLSKESIEALGFDKQNSGPGSIAADINIGINVSVPIMGYGLTEKSSIGLIVPIYQVDTSVATAFNASKEGLKWMNSISSPSSKAHAKQMLETSLTRTLSSLGYEPLESESFTALGDIQIAYKYDVYTGKRHSFLWKNYLITPTGQEPNPDKLVDVPTGDGQWDLQTGWVYQYDTYIPQGSLPLKLSLTSAYTYQFADSIEKRIPAEEGSPLSADKESVDRKLGDQLHVGFGMIVGDTQEGSTFGASYDYKYSFATKYEGSEHEAIRYKWLEDMQGEAELSSLTFVYSYSTISAFRKKEFAIPLTAKFSYATPISGKNVNDAKIYFGEFILYF